MTGDALLAGLGMLAGLVTAAALLTHPGPVPSGASPSSWQDDRRRRRCLGSGGDVRGPTLRGGRGVHLASGDRGRDVRRDRAVRRDQPRATQRRAIQRCCWLSRNRSAGGDNSTSGHDGLR